MLTARPAPAACTPPSGATQQLSRAGVRDSASCGFRPPWIPRPTPKRVRGARGSGLPAGSDLPTCPSSKDDSPLDQGVCHVPKLKSHHGPGCFITIPLYTLLSRTGGETIQAGLCPKINRTIGITLMSLERGRGKSNLPAKRQR